MTPRELGRQLWERPLEPAEFERRVALALAETGELAELAELATWFKRRYPTASERLAYARRKHAQLTRRWPHEHDVR